MTDAERAWINELEAVAIKALLLAQERAVERDAASAAGEARGIERAAMDADCGCPGREAVLAATSGNSGERWRACGEANCCALTAKSIRALTPSDQPALDAVVAEAVARTWEEAAGERDARVRREAFEEAEKLVYAMRRGPDEDIHNKAIWEASAAIRARGSAGETP